jgi:hypothetical protein
MKTNGFAATGLLIALTFPANAQAQVSGVVVPQMGQASTISQGNATGRITGSERFLRRNRDPRAFVGADAREGRHFIGRQQQRATAPILSAVTTPPIPPLRDINSQLLQYRAGRSSGTIYRPRLVVGFQPAETVDGTGFVFPLDRVHDVIERGLGTPVEIRLEGETLVLTGTVRSKESRALAEQIARLEPMVWDVRNELVVADVVPSFPPPTPLDAGPTPTPMEVN